MTTNKDKAATWEMVVVHRLFRRELRLIPELIGRVAPGDTARAATLASFLIEIVDGLHHHHEAEDKLLWPLLLERVTFEAELVNTMERQHERVAGHIDALRDQLTAWQRSAAAEDRDRLVATLRDLHDDLLVHLDEEEERILPLVSEHITKEEWDRMGEYARSHLSKDRLLFQLGALLEDATEWERRAFLGLMPLPARVLWTLMGKRAYQKEITTIRGTG